MDAKGADVLDLSEHLRVCTERNPKSGADARTWLQRRRRGFWCVSKGGWDTSPIRITSDTVLAYMFANKVLKMFLYGNHLPYMNTFHIPQRNISKIMNAMRYCRKQENHIQKYPHKEWRGPQCNPKFFMWVVLSPLFSRRRGPHMKNFRVGSEMGEVGCVSLCLCVFFALDIVSLREAFKMVWVKTVPAAVCLTLLFLVQSKNC